MQNFLSKSIIKHAFIHLYLKLNLEENNKTYRKKKKQNYFFDSNSTLMFTNPLTDPLGERVAVVLVLYFFW